MSRNTIVNVSGMARRSTTSALSIAATADESRSLPSTLTAAVLGTVAVNGMAGQGCLAASALVGMSSVMPEWTAIGSSTSLSSAIARQ